MPATQSRIGVTVVVPTIGRPSLELLLSSLERSPGPAPAEVIVVDDRRRRAAPLRLPEAVRVLATGGGCGPAAARNAGWRSAGQDWVVFLDDDVVVRPEWRRALPADLACLPQAVAGVQGRIVVPAPAGRRPTDWERNVAGLESACWATADMAYRRSVLEEVGGFDEGFPRAFREDADLGLRITAAGYVIGRGERVVDHPVRPAPWSVSVRLQAGNADDVRMRHKHGPDWRRDAQAEPGRTGRHLLTTASGVAALAGAAFGRRWVAAASLAAWAAGTGELAWTRIRPGPRSTGEVAAMVTTSAVLPVAATFHGARGWAQVAGDGLRRRRAARAAPGLRFAYPTVRDRWRFGALPRRVTTDVAWRPKAVFLDRDGTLMVDTGYPRRAEEVRLMPGARVAVDRIRRAGLATGVVTNQSGVGRGLITLEEMRSVNDRLERLVGPIDTWAICCHDPGDGCDCRKPSPGLVLRAADVLGIRPSDCVVVGDIGADVGAAEAAGARSILVPTTRTRPSEVRRARQVAPNLLTAVDLLMGGRC